VARLGEGAALARVARNRRRERKSIVELVQEGKRTIIVRKSVKSTNEVVSQWKNKPLYRNAFVLTRQ
jgi:G:T-mismatch repair DNA endonuclease (very short patch repair protein)